MRKFRDLLAIVLVISLILPIANAIFDPLEYYPEEKKYKIDTPILGTDLVDITLISNTYFCYMNCEAVLKIYPYSELEVSNKEEFDWNFHNIYSSKIDYSNYWFEVRIDKSRIVENKDCIEYEINNIGKNATATCSKWEITYKNITWYEWEKIDFNNYNFPIREDTYIKIKGIKPKNSNIEWIPKFYGYDLDAWAWWSASYGYRQNITNESSSDLAFAINGTNGFGGNIVWYNPTNLAGTTSVYYNSSSIYAVANETTEDNYDSESVGANNSATSIYNANASAVYHFTNNGSAEDSTSNENDGTVTNTPFTTNGLFGSAYDFDGDDDPIITFNISPIFNDEWSIILWINTTDAGEEVFLFGVYDSDPDPDEYIHLFSNIGSSDGNTYFQMNGDTGGGGINVSIPDWNDGNWHMIAVTKSLNDISTFKIYFDGNLQSSDSSGDAGDLGAFSSTISPEIGARGGAATGNPIDGTIDEVRIYDLELTGTQIGELYNNSQNLNNLLGAEETSTYLSLSLTNINESDYKNIELQPDVLVKSSSDFNVTLDLVNDANGSIYNILTTSELAGTYTNNSIIINTTIYMDGDYYLNLTGSNSYDTGESISSTFEINNLDLNISYSCSDLVTETIYPNVTINSTQPFNLYVYLNSSGTLYSVYNKSDVGGNYKYNDSIDITDYTDSNYSVYASATDGLNTETNESCKFTVDTTAPAITVDWNIDNDWYSSLNHYLGITVTDSVDLTIECNITFEGNLIDTEAKRWEETEEYSETGDWTLKKTFTFTGDQVNSTKGDAWLRTGGTDTTCWGRMRFYYTDSTNTYVDHETTSTSYVLTEFENPYTNLTVSKIEFYLKKDADVYTVYAKNISIYVNNFENGTEMLENVTLVNGVDDLTIYCVDDAGNQGSYDEDMEVNTILIDIKDEEGRDDFGIENFTAHMFASSYDKSNITYENVNESQMASWYFIMINDSVKTLRLAIETLYYRSQTDTEELNGTTFYMYNSSQFSSSQILFKIDTVGYDKPIIVKRPRDTGEDLITAEYPIGSEREVNAYLIDSRVYNIYGYDDDDNLILIDTLMVTGTRTIHLTIPDIADIFTNINNKFGHIWAENYTYGNYTIYVRGYDDAGSYTITLYNSSDDQLAIGTFTDTGTLTYDAGNISLLNNTYFYAVFTWSDGTSFERSLLLGSEGITLGDWGILSFGGFGWSIAVLIIMLAIAGTFAGYSAELGLGMAAGIGFLFALMIPTLSVFISIYATTFAILGGILFAIKIR